MVCSELDSHVPDVPVVTFLPKVILSSTGLTDNKIETFDPYHASLVP